MPDALLCQGSGFFLTAVCDLLRVRSHPQGLTAAACHQLGFPLSR